LDSDGNKLWDQAFGGDANDYIFGLATNATGGFTIAGHSASDLTGNKASPGFGGPDFWLLRVPEPLPALLPGSLQYTAGQFTFAAVGAPGQTNVVQLSTNLVDWAPLFTNVFSGSGTNTIVDTNALTETRFYRVQTPGQ
jgi:hypothetical protein